MPWIRKGIALLCASVGLLFLTINSVLLARGAVRWGLELWEQIAYAAVAASVPWVIAIMPFLVVSTWKTGVRFGRPTLWTLVACLMWLVFAAYNFLNATGAISLVRGDVVAQRAHDYQTESDKRDRRKRLAAERDAAGTPRPASTVTALIAAEKQQRDWQWSSECKNALNQRQRLYCANLEKLQAELEAGKRVDKLNEEISHLDALLAGTGPVSATADPQVEFLHTYTGWNRTALSYGLAASTPLVLELGSMFLFGLSVLLMGWSHHVPAPEPRAVKPQQAALPPTGSLETSAITRQTELARYFFSQCTRPVAAGALSESEWYAHYRAICERSNDKPLPVDSFRRIARSFLPVVEIDGQHFYKEYLPIIPKNAA